MQKNLYLFVFIVAGSTEERRCCAVFSPMLPVPDEAWGCAGLPALGQGCGDHKGNWGWGRLSLGREGGLHVIQCGLVLVDGQEP